MGGNARSEAPRSGLLLFIDLAICRLKSSLHTIPLGWPDLKKGN
jgi:hypothetical protein